MKIRQTNHTDHAIIHALYLDAFNTEPYPETGEGGAEVAELAITMLETENPLLSLAAVEHETIIGHILFSPLKVATATNLNAYILAPLAVATAHQKQGLGKALISAGFEQLKTNGVEAVFTLGDPAYYGKSGFTQETRILPPYQLPYMEAWQSVELVSGALENYQGTVECIAPLMPRKFW